MELRTDLALEVKEQTNTQTDGLHLKTNYTHGLKVTTMDIATETAAQKMRKPLGTYITIEHMPLTDSIQDAKEQTDVLAQELRRFLPAEGSVLVVGLGNSNITPDALGVRSADHVLATRHISGEIARSSGLDQLRPVSVIAPGVLGQTGIESAEMVASVVKSIRPAAVIVIDSLASCSLSRLGCTIQITDTGIAPGAGVQNSRRPISPKGLNVPVIAIGVPTVVEARTLVMDILEQDGINAMALDKVFPHDAHMIVTPSEIDLLIERAAAIIGMAVNIALHHKLSSDDLRLLCG
ncbi:MAG: GPR endopeptidase [Acutalibacteraceae bacterium]